MDYFNIDPSEQRLPPEETKILSLLAEPYSDRRRVHVTLQLTPFQQPPFIELTLVDSAGDEVGAASIIEPPRWKQEIIMHIKNSIKTAGEFTLLARLFYPEKEDQDKRSIKFTIPDAMQK